MSRPEQVIVDLSAVTSNRELHEVLKRGLGFPDWYGMNWDAFWDAITGLVEMPERLQFTGWSSFEARLPAEAQQLKSSLEQMSSEFPHVAATVSCA